MDWQKQFDERYTQCALVADKIFPLTVEFEKLEKEHGLFIDVLRKSAAIEDGAKMQKFTKWQYYIGFPIIFGFFGMCYGITRYNGYGWSDFFPEGFHWDAPIAELDMVMPENFLTPEFAFPIAVGFFAGLAFALWVNAGKGISKVMHLTTEEQHKFAKDRLIKKLKPSQKLQAAIIEAQYDLITQQDELIEGEWAQALASLEELLDKAPSGRDLANNASKLSDMKKIDETFTSLTKKVMVSQERERAKEEAYEKGMKICAGVLAVAGIAAVGLASIASHGMKDFGSTPNSSSGGTTWVNKETGETFDYDPRS